MNTTLLVVVLAAALGGMALVVNHMQARVALLEVMYNEGLPPGHERTPVATGDHPAAVDAAKLLGAGTHIFLSRACHACQRLLAELTERSLDLDDVRLHYVDRPRPGATEAARVQQAELRAQQAELAQAVVADPLPHTITVGPHGLVAAGVTPTARLVVATAARAGVGVR